MGAINNAIWEPAEDSIRIAYQFFQIPREPNEKKEVDGKDLDAAYQKRCKENADDEEWQKICLSRTFTIVSYLFEEFRTLLDQGHKLKELDADPKLREMCAKFSHPLLQEILALA